MFEFLCFIQLETGQIVNLDFLCGQPSIYEVRVNPSLLTYVNFYLFSSENTEI